MFTENLNKVSMTAKFVAYWRQYLDISPAPPGRRGDCSIDRQAASQDSV
jgi:hypothetical protein